MPLRNLSGASGASWSRCSDVKKKSYNYSKKIFCRHAYLSGSCCADRVCRPRWPISRTRGSRYTATHQVRAFVAGMALLRRVCAPGLHLLPQRGSSRRPLSARQALPQDDRIDAPPPPLPTLAHPISVVLARSRSCRSLAARPGSCAHAAAGEARAEHLER